MKSTGMNRPHNKHFQQGVALLVLSIFICCSMSAQKNVIPGRLTSPYPTMIHLAFEWTFTGDDNQNSTVTVRYKEKAAGEWREAMPLRRIEEGRQLGFSWKKRFSGSIFDLKPGTVYVVRLRLEDPDGGIVEKTMEAKTRPLPRVTANAEIHEIKPGRYDTLFTKSGTPEKPVVYRCLDGEAKFTFIDVRKKKYVFIQHLSVENLNNEGVGIRMDGSENCAIQWMNIHAVYGIVADRPGIRNCYISDNDITGTCTWALSSLGNDGDNVGEGIQITGPGNVICYNKVAAFRDCISTMEDQRAFNQVCIDIYNNDIYQGADDGIEADFCGSNCRITRNRITDCCVGLSSQPSLGGPTYFIRNVMYNIIHSGFKLKRFSRGDVVLHNTLVKVGVGLGGNSRMDYAYFRNNLAFGGPTYNIVIPGGYDTGLPYAADMIDPGLHSSFDYDAIGVWGVPYQARIGDKPFTAVEKNGIERLDFNKTFSNVKFPQEPFAITQQAPDLRPASGASVIDAALLIPNVNDEFTGNAPDCGAYEAGQEFPEYGPRKSGR
jgi:hypothetical protein